MDIIIKMELVYSEDVHKISKIMDLEDVLLLQQILISVKLQPSSWIQFVFKIVENNSTLMLTAELVKLVLQIVKTV